MSKFHVIKFESLEAREWFHNCGSYATLSKHREFADADRALKQARESRAPGEPLSLYAVMELAAETAKLW